MLTRLSESKSTDTTTQKKFNLMDSVTRIWGFINVRDENRKSKLHYELQLQLRLFVIKPLSSLKVCLISY